MTMTFEEKKRLIDADVMRDDWLENGENEYVYDTNAVLDCIDSQPTVDAVSVVRCRECVNCLIDNTERKYHLCMRHNSVFPRKVDLMDFCSYGERKEGTD